MAIDAWLPIGYELQNGVRTHVVALNGINWQILETQDNGRALVVRDDLARRWIESGLIELGQFNSIVFGDEKLWVFLSGSNHALCSVERGNSPKSKAEALSFGMTLCATRLVDSESSLHDALYVEKISRLLPTYTLSPKVDDDVVLGYWLTGGAGISVKSFRRLHQSMSWIGASQLKEVVQAAGFEIAELIPSDRSRTSSSAQKIVEVEHSDQAQPQIVPVPRSFELAGRPELAAFFNEHVVDIIQNRDRYSALGIEFPSAVILHGPPGCGKTFAVDRLIDFLGWPNFQIDASSVASPYIHETSKKVADVFSNAMENAPSVLVIDEMEAFLADREMGSGHHRVEEVAEFLRRIPEAIQNDVLIIAMTNRVDMIDPAILRRGRFDHVIKVDFASEEEVLALLEKLLATLPKEADVDPKPFAKELAGRPLSDVTFIVREGARLAARSGEAKLSQSSLQAAMNSSPAREREGTAQRRIGFI